MITIVQSMLFYMLVVIQYSNVTSHDECPCNENKYSSASNQQYLSRQKMFKQGHMRPFGSHRPPMKTEVLNYMISPEAFYMHYVSKHKPVIFKDVTKVWPAYSLWSDEYLKKYYGDEIMHMETKDDDKLNIPPNKSFKEFLEVYKSTNLYLVDEVLPAMREEVYVPLCLRCEEIDQYFFVSYYWHSNGETMSSVHIDTDENLLCVIKGHKKVLMVSPIHTHDLYADDARQMGVLDVNASAIDLEKYPNIMNVHYYEASLEEGDCLYLPQMWWHQVYSRKERQLAIAMWWKSKPFWKKVGDNEDLKSAPIPEERRKVHSYGDSLIDYELWVQNVSSNLPPIKCNEQKIKMSKYTWETDKDEEALPTLGDGGDIEEDLFEDGQFKTSGEINQKLNEIRREKITCDFDKQNEKSPCYINEDDEAANVRYVMDYCQQFEDRGCVINKPQLLNKLMNVEFQKMAFQQKSKFKP